MRVANGLWVSLVNEYHQRVIYQCATDQITEVEFLELWQHAGRVIWREISSGKDASMEYRVRAQKV